MPSVWQGYKMKNEDRRAFYDGERLEGGIHTAVEAWCADPAAAKSQYGPIASWNTSEITNMSSLFLGKAGFNEDISRWDVSNVTSLWATFSSATSFNGDLSRWDVGLVTDMRFTFDGATSFNQQLGGVWSDSTARKYQMFASGCPGSIA